MKSNKQSSVLLWALVAALLSQNLLIPVICSSTVNDKKCATPPDPHAGTPPTGSYGTPPSHGSYGTPPSHGDGGSSGTPPSHGGGGSSGTPPSHGGGGSSGTPPSHGGGGSSGTPPSHGGGGSYGGSPPCGCAVTPPSGGHHTPTPSTPTPTLDPPSSGYTHTPPISGGGTPLTPIVSFTPPATPIVVPGVPIPGTTFPSPPYVIDPNSPPFSCNYWSSHSTLIWELVGWFGTLRGAFSLSSIPNLPSIPGLGSSTTLLQALTNTRSDGYGSLCREGTAALLNSMIDHRFPFTTNQVRDHFVSATNSNKAAAAQGRVFKLANEGRLKI